MLLALPFSPSALSIITAHTWLSVDKPSVDKLSVDKLEAAAAWP
jgi:hypothetical protein